MYLPSSGLARENGCDKVALCACVVAILVHENGVERIVYSIGNVGNSVKAAVWHYRGQGQRKGDELMVYGDRVLGNGDAMSTSMFSYALNWQYAKDRLLRCVADDGEFPYGTGSPRKYRHGKASTHSSLG